MSVAVERGLAEAAKWAAADAVAAVERQAAADGSAKGLAAEGLRVVQVREERQRALARTLTRSPRPRPRLSLSLSRNPQP